MKDTFDIKGVICPMVTPFDGEDRIDFDSTRRVVDFMLSKGIAALMVAGTTGEGMLLSLAERRALCEVVVEQAAGRVAVVVHTGCMGTADTVDLTRHAASVGATAASVIVPYFFSYDDDLLFDHFLSVAEAVPGFPVLIYAFPGNAKNDISPSLLERLRPAAPNIVGMKVSNPNLLRLQEYLEVGGEGFAIFCGVDGLMLPALALGAQGQVSGNANVFPEIFCRLYDTFMAGNIEGARKQQRLINCIRLALRDGLHPAYFKAGLKLRGVPAGYVRPPMRELTAEELQELKRRVMGFL
jgi:dihydrodipicolinate synthase/N-acetylneuraminate lyase